jgi:hypothetical protein
MVVRSGGRWEYGGDGGGGEYVGFYVISTKIGNILISCATKLPWLCLQPTIWYLIVCTNMRSESNEPIGKRQLRW